MANSGCARKVKTAISYGPGISTNTRVIMKAIAAHQHSQRNSLIEMPPSGVNRRPSRVFARAKWDGLAHDNSGRSSGYSRADRQQCGETAPPQTSAYADDSSSSFDC